MSLFGFVYSEEKLAPFDYTAEILGVVVDLSKASQRIFSISNKPSRVGDLSAVLQDILQAGVVVPNQLPSVLSKLQYADSHVCMGTDRQTGFGRFEGAGPHFPGFGTAG